MTRRVAVVTGTRAEYGLLRSSMEGIRAAGDLELMTVATGMHLSPQHGYTVEEIRSDEFTVDAEVEMLFRGDSGASMARSLGAGIAGLTQTFEQFGPDIVIVLGDRDEAFAGAVAAAHMMIPVAHVHGGDAMTGATIDDSIRHALTKFAHLHFPASEESATRIERLGEEPWRITTVGAPGLDQIRREDYTDPATVRDQFGFDPDAPLLVIVQHPETARPEAAADQMRTTLDALAAVDHQALVIKPNADAGNQAMIEVLEDHAVRDGLTVVDNLPREEYLGALAAADAMVGNSSSGIIEAPSFDLPVVAVGDRQEGRERADNVLEIPFDTDRIAEAIHRCLSDESFLERVRVSTNPYDYGGAGERIVERVRAVDIDDDLLQKRITY